MKKNVRICVCLVTALIALLLSGCSQAGNKNEETAGTAMLLDKSAAPAPHALIRLQERPVFQVDDRKRPLAMIDDRIDKVKADDKLLTIREIKPD